MKETDVAESVVKMLAEDGFDVFQEVMLPLGNRADIVAMRGSIGYVIECKMGLGFDVLAQALDAVHYAEFVAVAVPSSKSNRARQLALTYAMDKGLGVIEVSSSGSLGAIWRVHPRFTRYGGASLRKPPRRLVDIVEPEHRYALAAGSNRGGYHTPYKRTCAAVQSVVAQSPGLTPKEVLAKIDAHWAPGSARASLVSCILRGIMPGLRIEKDGKAMRIYPAPVTPMSQ